MRRVAFTLFLLAASCAGGTCGGCADEDYVFPRDDPQRPDALVQEDVVRVRITQGFLDFVRPRLPELLLAQAGDLGGGVTVDAAAGVIRVPLPDQDLFDIGVAEARLREGEAIIFLDDLEQRLRLDFTEPAGAALVLDNLRVGINLKLKEDVLGIDSSCPVRGDLGGDPRHAAEVTVRTTIDPGVGPRPDYALDMNVSVGNLSIDDFDVEVVGQSTYCRTERECRDCGIEVFGTCLDPGGRCSECIVFCGGITDGLASLVGALTDVLRPVLNGILAPIVDDLIADAVAGIDGTPAKVETPLDLATLSGLDLLRRAQPIGLFAAPRPGQLPVNDRGAGLGMELTFDGGFEAPAADCIGQIGPFVPEAGPAPALSGQDRTGEPYHLGVTLSASYFNQALYSAHRSGALCLKLSTQEVRALTGGAFTLNASLLSLIASDLNKLADPAAPVILEVKPRNPATVSLGSGEQVGQDPMGNDLFDWLLNLQWIDVGIAFHVLIEDRYVRVFEVTTDVAAGLNLSVQPDNTLQVALGELRIDDFQEQFNELLPNADFGEVLPTLLDVALGAVLSQALVFDLDLTNAVSDALGGAPILLRVNEIYRDGVQEDYLTTSLTFTDGAASAYLSAVETFAELHANPGLVEPSAPDVGGSGWSRPTGVVRLVVGEASFPAEGDELEYQVRVDKGLWSVWRPSRADGVLMAPDARLKLPGWHTIEVRARRQGDYTSRDPTPAVIRAFVDPIAPRVSARFGPVGVDVVVRDAGDHLTARGRADQDARSLTLERRGSTGTWYPVPLTVTSAVEAEATIAYGHIEGDILRLRARDGSGNASPELTLSVRQPTVGAPVPTVESTTTCRCVETGAPRPAAAALLLVLAVVWRRRRSMAL